MVLNILLGIAAGVMALFQTTVNAQLRRYVLTPYAASLISFLVGLALLFVIDLAQGSPILPGPAVLASIPWWAYTGGLMGMAVMTSFIILVPIIGPVQTVAMPILGQIIMGMLIDQFGWIGAIKSPASLWNLLGVAVLIAGVFCVVILPNLQKGASADAGSQKAKWIGRLVGILAGMLMAVQIAVNGQFGIYLGSTVQAALISFAIGVAVLLVINLVQGTLKNLVLPVQKRAPAWVWLGGVFGAMYILLNAINAPVIGTGAVVVLALLGQLTSSVLVEQFGWCRTQVNKVKSMQILGLAEMLAGVVLIKLV